MGCIGFQRLSLRLFAQVWAATGYDYLGCHRGHKNAVTCLALDSNFLFSGSDDCTICLWDTVPAVANKSHFAGACSLGCVALKGALLWTPRVRASQVYGSTASRPVSALLE